MFLYDALGFFEKQLAKAQGKGYGSSSIDSEINSIKKLLGEVEPALCIDIGGNIGDYTAGLNKRFPDSRIVCFEPSQTNVALLQGRFGSNKNISVESVGVSNQSGTHTLFSDKPGSGLGSLTKRNLSHFNREFDIEEAIRIIKFEDYWQQKLRSAPIDILKMDIEGHELDALEGCGEALSASKVVQFEFGGCNIDTRTYFQDFWYFFTERDFSLFRITPFGLSPLSRYKERDEAFRTTNFLARKNPKGSGL